MKRTRSRTTKELQAMFDALACRLDAIGEALSGATYGERAVRNLRLRKMNPEGLDFYFRGKTK